MKLNEKVSKCASRAILPVITFCVVGLLGTATEAGQALQGKNNKKETTMTQTTAVQSQTEQPDGSAAIREFRASFKQEELEDLRRRIAAVKWPTKETVADATQGVQLATMRKLADYWQNGYDLSRLEAKLNAYPQFKTEIDGLEIHYIHVRSKEKNALPIIITHGWPGSIVEQMKIIEPLTDPVKHGGTAADAFDVVIPSMPGYGFSAQPEGTGWDPERIARAWATLMQRLGYTKYVAQGGDWGALITQLMGKQAPAGLAAIHTNMPGAVPPDINRAALAGAPPPANLSAEEKHAYEQLVFFYGKGLAYAQEMGNRPQTLYGVADSPIGLAAWILDHDAESYAMIARVFDGKSEGITRDDVLDNITLYWLTNTGVSSARLYWENKLPFFEPMGVKVPVAVSAFPTELYTCPRNWAEKAFPKLIHFNKLPKGGHFAAWEQPEYFTSEMRAAFRSIR